MQVRYPFLPWVAELRDNSGQAWAIQLNVEKNLISRGLHGTYCKEMEKAEAGGTFSRVSEEELWASRKNGRPIHYIALFGVEQPKHEGHKLRVVANCKLKNRHCILSINVCLERPPNALVPLIVVLL